MQQEAGKNHILAELMRLYRNLSAKILHRRLNTYRSVTSAGGGVDTISYLDDHITRLCEQSASSTRPAGSQKATARNREHAQPCQPANENIVKELSSHFRHNFSSSAQQPQLASKLRDSSWHHINMALSLARQGDRENALMHSQLANNAIQMAAHYMSDEVYQNFCCELQTSLKAIGKDSS